MEVDDVPQIAFRKQAATPPVIVGAGRLVVVADFITLLNEKDRQIVVVLNSGVTKLTDVTDILGYANNSAISKRLNRIRVEAQRYFDEI